MTNFVNFWRPVMAGWLMLPLAATGAAAAAPGRFDNKEWAAMRIAPRPTLELQSVHYK
jgi:hypothetical protein